MSGREEAQLLYEMIRNQTLPPENFSHEEHIRLAWYYLTTWPRDEACRRFEADFKAYISSIGATGKYHHTITYGLLRLLDTHLDTTSKRTNWDHFREDAAPAFNDALGVLTRFWRAPTLFSDSARLAWQAPDLLPIPARD